MLRLRGVGFFRELSTSSEGPSIYDALSSFEHPDEQEIVRYLTQCKGLFGRGGYISDVLNPLIKGLTTGVKTDGVFAWPSELAYYVKTYHTRLPEDFVSHMRANNWRPPAEDSIELEDWVID